MGVKVHVLQGVYLCTYNLAVDTQFLCQNESLTDISIRILGIVSMGVFSFVTSFYWYYGNMMSVCKMEHMLLMYVYNSILMISL